MDEALIVVSIISVIGMVLTTQLWQLNWFKRENFKIQKSNVMKTNAIKLEQLRREVGIGKLPAVTEDKSLIDSLKGLDVDKIKDILGMVQNDEDEGYEDENILEGALKEILANPELKEKGMKLLKDLTGDKKEDIYEARFER